MTQRPIRYNNSSDLKRYTLKSGEEKEVTFTISVEDHKFYDLNMNYIDEEYLKFSSVRVQWSSKNYHSVCDK